ncbi:MAG: CDP-alcohol phosphatidyltransferase family protein [Thermomicrobiales bacterium]|nr:CDP-alcohol phosphatidyltransferase family protein [Thermomicrobiales bacterium]
MISEWIGPRVRTWMLRVGRVLSGWGLSPNLLTVLGLVLNGLVAVVIAMGHPVAGGAFLLIASAFDMLDGAVARADDSVTRFGGFLDSTLDRYSEIVIFVGVLVYLLDTPDGRIGSVLVLLSATGALMISYVRARAEAAGFGASVGLLPRPERVILLAICLLLGRPIWALWILAIFTHVTAAMRILHVWRAGQAEATAKTRPASRGSGAAS